MKLWIWRNFRIKLPDDWEMLRFSRDFAQGRCSFADRYNFRLEFSWRVLPSEPDMKKLLSDYRAKFIAEKNIRDDELINVFGWRGLKGITGDILTVRYGNYIKEQSCLVEVVFLWPKELARDEKLEENILNSIRDEKLNENGLRHWALSGIDFFVSPELLFNECRIEPALTVIAFKDHKEKYREERFERSGMVKEWLKTGVDKWLESRLPREFKKIAGSNHTKNGHNIYSIEARRRGGILFRKQVFWNGAAWICPQDGRLYFIAISAARDAKDRKVFGLGQRLLCDQTQWDVE